MEMRDEVIGALIGLARTMEGIVDPDEEIYEFILQALYKIQNPGIQQSDLEELINSIHEKKNMLAPDCAVCACPCGKNEDYDMSRLTDEPDNIVSIKLALINILKDIAFRLCTTDCIEQYGEEWKAYLCEVLFLIGYPAKEKELWNTMYKFCDVIKRK